MPMPPSRASAIASRASVTVSIAAETTGMLSSIVGVSRVRVETSFGSTRDSAGTRSTSSNVRPSLANFRSRATSRCSSSWRSSTLKGSQGTTPSRRPQHAPNRSGLPWPRCARCLLLPLAVAAAAFHSAGAGPRAETIYSHADTTIAAFAQDGALVAWFSPSRARCNTVHVISLANPLQTTLPLQGTARNVTCRWVVGSSPGDPRARRRRTSSGRCRSGRRSPSTISLGAGVGVGERKERRFQEIAHTNHGSGLWLGGTSGDGATLVYGVTAIDYVDEAGCLAGTGSCELEVSGGGVYRMSGRQAPKLIPGTDSRRRRRSRGVDGCRRVRPGRRRRQAGPPARGRRPADRGRRRANGRVDLARQPAGHAARDHARAARPRDARAHAARRFASPGTTARPARRRARCRCRGKTSPALTATDRTIVFHVGRSIRAVDVETHNVRTLARAAAEPVGLSLEGRRLAWAENLKTAARIRALDGQAVIGCSSSSSTLAASRAASRGSNRPGPSSTTEAAAHPTPCRSA